MASRYRHPPRRDPLNGYGVGAAPNQWHASCLGKAPVSALRGWLPAVVLRGDIGHDAAYRSSREEQA